MGKKKDVAPILSAMGVLTSIVTDLVKLVTKLGGTMEAIYRLATPEGAETLETVAKVIADDFREAQNTFLKLISGTESLVIEALDGQATIAKAENVFMSYIDSDFKSLGLDKASPATVKTGLDIYDLKTDATFSQMFGSLADNLDKLVMSQAQIISFCQKYPDWLRQDGYATFFLIKENKQYFVTSVGMNGGGLRVEVIHLENDCAVWKARERYRLVTPSF